MDNENMEFDPFEIRDDDPNALEVAKMKIQIMESMNNYMNEMLHYKDVLIYRYLVVSISIITILLMIIFSK